ncbi:Chromodomain-helicase-DNA-binding protein [Wickerhamomyces ciferrii]|uniref:Chromodomain-helicase-DNA-binding protein n=1 Tax=Wickerhamomyces ciferrii (strain ATCC 14091 / BCRC 22168 / CBS 111 / JCM 3599 / NBRC 0793 / NRRL Y-1031 F-60-10) TaxID=1206466 RepID=K0KZY8_WICCF|nr:Chromodomain-helicase-DNA-binding protein [Wickerhamomyces ciferrii]CCH46708.1 Chromodomain-helicase-DNA-binding protein [Wickerhamomyces ciferrii]
MHAAQGPNNNKASLRNQLLSTDIGNIDVRHEVPINGQAPPAMPIQSNFNQYSPQQQHPQIQAHMNNGYSINSNPNFNGSNSNLNQTHIQQGPPQQFNPNNYVPHQMQYAPPPFNQNLGQPRSRRSSMQSNGSFTKSSMNNLFKMNKSKSKFSGGGDDDDDEEKDVMIDDNGTEMSFDDISTLRDRGRYGGQSSFDSTPIIPTLSSTSSARPGSTSNMSNVQYRKQMTAFKKQVMTNAGKVINGPNDPRAMSLQSGGRNPYIDANQNNFDPRAMSLQGFNPYLNDPRTRSMTNQSPQPFQPRTNSLTNQPQQTQNYPRAYSLTTNPYQNRPHPHHPSNAARPHMNPGLHPPLSNHQFPPNAAGSSPTISSQQGPAPQGYKNSASSIPLGVNSQTHQNPHGSSSRTSLHNDPSFNGPAPPVLRNSHNSNSFSGYNPSTPTIEEAPSFPEKPNLNSNTTERSNESLTKSQSDDYNSKEGSHHYLADNTLNNNDHFDSSGVTFSDVSGTQDKSFNPKGESTPSPFDEEKQKGSLDSVNSENDSPSKLPRTKGLPHLSLLKMRDEDPEEDHTKEDETSITKNRALNTVEENDYSSNNSRSKTPPLNSGALQNKSPQRLPFGTPNRRSNMQSKQVSPSPLKKQSSFNTHRKYPLTNVSISSMSEYSTFSGVSDSETNDFENKKKIYQLAQNSGTTNDVFVTASQFSLMDNNNLSNKKRISSAYGNDDFPDTITEGDSIASETPKLDSSDQEKFSTDQGNRGSAVPTVSDSHTIRNSISTETGSIKSSKSNSGSLKGSFKSPSFLKNWSKKRNEKKKNNSFETVTKPVEIKTNGKRQSYSDSVDESVKKEEFHNNSNIGVSKGLNIMGGDEHQKNHKYPKEDFDRFNTNKNLDDEKISDNFGFNDDTSNVNEISVRNPSQNNIVSHPTSVSGTYNSSFTNNTIDTDFENYSDGSELNGKSSASAPATLKKLSDPVKVEDGTRKLKGSIGPNMVDHDMVNTNVKRLNLTIEQLGIMEDKSALVRELELVSKELGDSIRREIKLEDQLKGKDINSSPNLNYEHQLREQALLISTLEKQLNEERTKRYIAEEHVLLWENGQEPSALEISYENERLQSELSNKTEVINKQQAELDSFSFEAPKNIDKYATLEKANKEFESVTIPKLKNEIEILSNDRKKLSMIMEKFKLLRVENAELERKLEEGDQLKESQSKKLEDELAEMKNKFQNRINRASVTSSESKRQSLSTPISSRMKKTFMSELGSSNSSVDVLKPPSPMNGKRINSFSLINVTSPNEK